MAGYPVDALSGLRFAAVAVALAGSFLSGLVGIFAGIFATVLLLAFAVLGLAVLHAVTRGARSRTVILGSAYTALVLLGWPILIASLLGLADAAFDLRTRIAAWRGLPPPTRT